MTYQSGRQFLQIPGPTNIPERVLRAIAAPVLDHRGPEFARLASEVLARIKPIFKTSQPVLIFPASGTGAWESALVNTLSAGDKVLGFDSGQFALLWTNMARKLGLEVQTLATDWRRAPDPASIEAALAEDHEKKIKAVLLVHNETANGCMSRVAEIRQAMDRVGHPALLMVDTISSLGCADFRMDEWGVDIAIGG
jgi:alanine-glyoxylate transaminase/serine-glyoxylate transaminase/serine-pyruvate transaminase